MTMTVSPEQTVANWLQSQGSQLSVDELSALLADAQRSPSATTAPLSAAEAVAIQAVSGLSAEGQDALRFQYENPHLLHRLSEMDHVRADLSIAEHSLSTKDFAQRIGRDVSSVNRKRQRGAIYAVNLASGPRLPAWQINDVDHRLLTNLADVVPSIPSNAHPLTVEAVVTSEAEELGGLSPVAWLESGGDPGVVRQMLANLAYLS